ncbi:hypothetical protein [Akkermansia muciniphila]|uniref:hypothetical protein n=1 Tax=Akkermansia muciniphila TaxID=239935 RepID=UPI00117A076C|nr:hypothetical protein [Akkermansia muciniphila]
MRAVISIISILLFFQENVLAVDQTRCRVERRYLAFFTPWGKEPPTPPDIVEEVLGDMVESIRKKMAEIGLKVADQLGDKKSLVRYAEVNVNIK